MRTDQQAGRAGLRGGVEPAQVPGGIDADVCTQLLQPRCDLAVNFAHGRRKKCAASAAGIFAEARQLPATGDGKFRAGLEGACARLLFALCLQLIHCSLIRCSPTHGSLIHAG
jgi:hypothetical protein